MDTEVSNKDIWNGLERKVKGNAVNMSPYIVECVYLTAYYLVINTYLLLLLLSLPLSLLLLYISTYMVGVCRYNIT